MAIDPVSSALTSSGTGGAQQLGQNEFLKLMMAQLKNQDPLKPLDPTQFVGQLAQFSTVTGIQNMQTSIETLVGSMRSSQVLSGASLVGRDVLAPATKVSFTSGSTVSGIADVPEGTKNLKVRVLDSSGQVVRTFDVKPQEGFTQFTWDGVANDGTAAPSGSYKFEVIAGNGTENLSLDLLLTSRVSSVSIDPNTADLSLNTNNGSIALSSVRRVM